MTAGTNRSMPDETRSSTNDAPSEWVRQTFDEAVQEIVDLGIVDGQFVEARPSWALPENVVIGQIRGANESTTFRWVICGDLPTDHVSSDAATTPRDAARHFSLKWQLDATRADDPSDANSLAANAEALYELVEDDSLWQ